MVRADVLTLSAVIASVHGFVPTQRVGPIRISLNKLSQSSNTATELDSSATSAPGVSGAEAREKILKEPALWEYNFGLQDPGLTLPHGIVKDVTAPEKFEISEEQVRTLEEDGVVHIKGVFDDEWVDYLRTVRRELNCK